VPTLSLLDGVSFNNETEVWTLEFETMQVDASVPDQINAYARLLYLTRKDTERSQGDTRNPCLHKNTSCGACRNELETHYVLLGEIQAVPGAALQRTLDCGDACSVNATLSATPGSTLQTLRLSIRHEDIRKNFGRVQDRVSPLYGSMLTIDFGVGMVFVPAANAEAHNGGAPANNIIIFDSFSIVANTFDQVAIVKQSAYSIATHVAFWTAKSQADANVRLATIEYLLDFGHALENITVALNDYSAPNTPGVASDRHGRLC
jgi:hypothetical protein